MSTGICRWLFLLISLSTWTKLTDSKEMRVVCYYTNWSVYRPGQAKFSPQNINPYLCTHLVYAFGGFTKENTLKPFDKYQDIEKGGYAKFTGLKTYNKNLKTLIAIGGWNEGSSRFSPMVANADRRKELVKNAIKFLRQNHFDGLDLDWEYPTFRDGGKPRDRDNYAQLVKELREEFERESDKTGRPRLLLTMAVPAGIEYINKGYDVPKLTKYLDWMNILSYDYHSAFEPAVNHHAPLYALEEDNEYNYDAELNIDYTIKHYVKLGADTNKLVLGIPTYGRSYTLFNPEAYEIGSPADGPGDMGTATRENGYLAYYEICENIKDQGWEVDEPNDNAMGPIAFKDNQWVGYDDENIVRKKAEYVAENSLGGIMFWAIDNDDFRGNCHGKPYPLIEAGKEALLNAYGLTEENLISPPSKPTKSSKTKPRSRPTKRTTTTEKVEEPSVSTTSAPKRRRIKSKNRSEERSSAAKRRKDSTSTEVETSSYSSLKIVTPSYTTPAPPATPDMGGDFKCEDEGFFPHPKDCKKYFWCLSGAGDSGIVAHQFTCPAGLYFNKGADSCDYSQNVLCKKKLQKAPSTTTTTEKMTESSTTSTTTSTIKPTLSSFFSTSRVPPKITAATSKTTFKSTTTTEAYEDDDYEYEDEEEELHPSKEEDPQVIKELIALIKKAGGLEELEKQLTVGKDIPSSSAVEATTQSALSKSLYERVLSKTSKNALNALRTTSRSRNSGGPQSEGLQKTDDVKKADRARPQYSSIARQRPSTEKTVDEEEEDDAAAETEKDENKSGKAKQSSRAKSTLEYVNIRRPKSSTTTESSDDDGFNRNRILGELDEDEAEEEEVEEEVKKKSNIPQYVNIRRQRPSTTEPSVSSSKYSSIRRSTVAPAEQEEEENNDDGNGDVETSDKNQSTTESNRDDNSPKYHNIRRSTTTSASISTEDGEEIKSRGSTTTSSPSTTETRTESRYKFIRRSTTTSSTPVTEKVEESSDSINRARSTTESTTATEGSSTESKYKFIRRSTTTTSTSAPVAEEVEESSDSILRVRSTTESSTTIENSTEAKLIGKSTTTPSQVEVESVSLNDINSEPSASSEQSASTESPTLNETSTLQVSKENDTQKDEASSVNAAELPIEQTPLSNTSIEVEAGSSSSPIENNNEPESSSTLNEASLSSQATERRRPVLFSPRPFTGSTSTLRPFSESPAKVGQSSFKLRARGSTISSTTTEAITVRSRSRIRFTATNRNEDAEQEEKAERAEIKFSRARARTVPTTTENLVDLNVEQNRKYRPIDIADLSSLTSVDLKGAEVNKRRRRPTGSTSSTSTTEKILTEDEKTGARTLPLARKLIDTSAFGKSRRIISKNNDQIDVESEKAATRKVVRRFRSTTAKAILDSSPGPDQAEPQENVRITPRSRKIIRRFRPTASTSEKPSTESEAISTSTNTPRKKLPLFKLNQAASSTTTTETASTSANPLLALFKARSRFDLSKNVTENENEEDDDSPNDNGDVLNGEEGENIKLSESNIRESSQINTFGFDDKLRKQFSKFGKSKEVFVKDRVDKVDAAPILGEEIEAAIASTTTTSTTATPSTISTAEISDDVTPLSRTEPTRILRTRKIIRKFNTTETSTTTEPNSKTYGRTRKVIRRLRPGGNNIDNAFTNENAKSNNKIFVRGRSTTKQPATSSTEPTTEKITNVSINVENISSTGGSVNLIELDTTTEQIQTSSEITSSEIINAETTTEIETTASSTTISTPETSAIQSTRGRYIVRTTTEADSSLSSERSRRIFRPKLLQKNTESASVVTEETEVSSRRPFRPLFGRKPTTGNTLVETTKAPVASSPRYNLYSRKPFSTTERYHVEEIDDDDEEVNRDDEENEEEDDNISENDDADDDTPKYTIYSSSSVSRTHKFESNTNFNDEDEENNNDGIIANKSISSYVFKTALNSLNQSETLVNKDDFIDPTEPQTEIKDDKSQVEGNQDQVDSSTVHNILFKPQKEKPIFTRNKVSMIKEEVQTKSQQDLLKSQPGIRPKLTTTTSATISESVSQSTELPEADTSTDIQATTELIIDFTSASIEEKITKPAEVTSVTSNEVEVGITTTEVLNETTLNPIIDELIDVNSVIVTETTLGETEAAEAITTSELPDTSTENTKAPLTTTTEFRRRSTLRSIKDRPGLTFSRRPSRPTLATSTIPSTSAVSTTRKTFTRAGTFNKNRFTRPSTVRSIIRSTTLDSKSTTPISIRQYLYQQRNNNKNEEDNTEYDEEEEDERDNEEEYEEEEVHEEERSDEIQTTTKSSFSRSSTTKKIINTPFNNKPAKTKANKPKFSKIANIPVTPTSDVSQDIGVDTEAVKKRNKNLFSKRKMNTPAVLTSTASTLEPVESAVTETEAFATTEAATTEKSTFEAFTTLRSSPTDATDPNLTTLHHVFAQVDDINTTTESINPSVNTQSGKIERLIEVNRIVEVKTKEAKVKNHTGALEVETKVKIVPTLDKIGEISRVTLIKVVDGNNETVIKDPISNEIGVSDAVSPVYSPSEGKSEETVAKVEEVHVPEGVSEIGIKNLDFTVKVDDNSQREERKFEIYGSSKVTDNKVLTNIGGKPEIIDGISHINVVTPKALVVTEASTISLEGLFHNNLNPSFASTDELLEAGRSEFVNVRVLNQDEFEPIIKADSAMVPVRVLPQDEEEVTMKAHVVEIRPKPDSRTIKIVPIRVEMSRNPTLHRQAVKT